LIQRSVLDQHDASALVQSALAEAAAQQCRISVAVCDNAGFPLALLRMDGAGLLTAKVAGQTARTAALLRAPSGVLAERARADATLLQLEDYLPMEGGVPVIVDGQCLGAVGISGGTPQQDVAIAEAAIAAHALC
jgi:glc operon protein GlcG